MTNTKETAGFTTNETWPILLAMFVIVLVIAVPKIIQGRNIANVTSRTVDTLSLISQDQTAFADSRTVDEDGDGVGDFGTRGQLSSMFNKPPRYVEKIDSEYIYTIMTSIGSEGSPPGFTVTAVVRDEDNEYPSLFIDESGIVRKAPAGETPDSSSPKHR